MSNLKNIFKRLSSPGGMAVLLLGVLLATFFAYQRGLSGSFIFDDIPNITLNPRIAIQDLRPETLMQASFSIPANTVWKRPLSMLSFALNYYYANGLHAYYFKVTNLVIHLLNGVSIFVLVRLLLRQYQRDFDRSLDYVRIGWISLAVASAWLLHPFNLTGVLYVVQRMTSLSALFCLWGMIFFVLGRMRMMAGKGGWALVLSGFLLFPILAILCKENGALLPCYLIVLEIGLFRFRADSRRDKKLLVWLFGLTVVMPTLIVASYTAIHPEWIMTGYQNRDFTLVERLMTEMRVFWFYLGQIVLPNNTQMTLFHDDIIVSRGLLKPTSTLLSFMGILVLSGVAIACRKKFPLLLVGVLFFCAGHAMESTVLPLEITYEHRNYLPMVGILLVMFFYLLHPAPLLKYWRMTCAVLLIGLFGFNTYLRAGDWASLPSMVHAEARNHPDSPRANDTLGDFYSSLVSSDSAINEKTYRLAIDFYKKSTRLDQHNAHGAIGIIRLQASRGKPIDVQWVAEAEYRLRQPPISPDVNMKLYGLVQCVEMKICMLQREVIEKLMSAAMLNPSLRKTDKAEILTVWGYYLYKVKNDEGAALDVMKQAITAMPDEPWYRLTLASFLISTRRYAEANEQLNIMQHMDKIGEYSADINDQRKRMTKTEKHD